MVYFSGIIYTLFVQLQRHFWWGYGQLLATPTHYVYVYHYFYVTTVAAGSDTYCSEQGPQLESRTNLQRDKKKMKYSRRLQIYGKSGKSALRFIKPGTNTHADIHTHTDLSMHIHTHWEMQIRGQCILTNTPTCRFMPAWDICLLVVFWIWRLVKGWPPEGAEWGHSYIFFSQLLCLLIQKRKWIYNVWNDNRLYLVDVSMNIFAWQLCLWR